MTRETQPYGLRLPPELRDKIEREAKMNGRSLNAEIVARLCSSVTHEYRQLSPVFMENTHPTTCQSMSDNERSMLALFKRWDPEKQLSFLVLFR